MSFVVANTEFVSGAAGNLARLGSMISAANSAAAAQTTAVAAAGADERAGQAVARGSDLRTADGASIPAGCRAGVVGSDRAGIRHART